uniref:KLK10 n=1 Tax=Macrostomum lignano TaxID=282301 RepID=A0A1I8HWE4_9PLAT
MHRLSILLLAAGLLATGLACCASACGQGWAALREGPRLPASDGQRAAAVNSQRSYRSLLLKTIFRTELLIIRNIDFDFC